MCGIAGIISTTKTEFNVNDFNTLGSFNDERGGDSCGIFIDGYYEVGIGANALFRNFMNHVEYPDEASIALLHCRKASYGYAINKDQAQPVVFEKDGKIEYVVMHNGTITNAKELANKYIPEFDTFLKSDTQIMANIFYNCGYDVLEEYTGTAVFVVVDYRKGCDVLLFKGESCYNEPKADCERPLFMTIKDNKFYFSSTLYSLKCINNLDDVYKIPGNKLLKVKDNELYIVKEYDRKKLVIKAAAASYYNANDDIYFNKDKCLYINNKTNAHGAYKLYSSGYKAPDSITSYYYNVYFFDGRCIANKTVFDFLTKMSIKYGGLIKFCQDFPEIIDYFSFTPISFDKGYSWYDVNDDFTYSCLVDGKWYTLFINGFEYYAKNGLVCKKYAYCTDTIKRYESFSKTSYDFDSIEASIDKFVKYYTR